MPKKILILNIFVLLVILLAPLISASISFSPQDDFVVPGLSKTIEQVQLNYYDSMNQPEFLASDGENIVLYLPESDSTIFSASLENNYLSYQILFADINRDSIPDILVGYYFDHQTYQGDTVCQLIFYDGARHYQKTDSAFFENVDSSSLFLNSPFQFVSLKTLDIDNDGYNELFFSFDQQHLWDFSSTSFLVTATATATMGKTILYYSFPDSIIWQKKNLSKKTDYLTNVNDTNYFITTCYENYTSKSAVNTSLHSNSTIAIKIFKSNGDSVATITKPSNSLLCTGDSTVFVSEYKYLRSGNIDTTDNQLNILVKHHWQRQCYYFSDTTFFDSSESELQLYRLTSLNEVEPVWSIDISDDFTDFFYDSNFPGSFFGINNNTVYQFNGSTGARTDVGGPFVADKVLWFPSPDNDSGKMVTFKDRIISLYTMAAQPTAVNDNNFNPNLPTSFALGQPYPNPFNSSTAISYSLARKAKVNISVYNLLGQKITTLVNEHKTAGAYRTIWDGNNQMSQVVSSGIYLINATFDNKTKTVKAILLK